MQLWQEEKTPELRSSDECSESFRRERSFFHFFSGSGRCRRVIRTSVASLWDVSEELKQDGGSSRGSGDGVEIVAPKVTSGSMEHTLL